MGLSGHASFMKVETPSVTYVSFDLNPHQRKKIEDRRIFTKKTEGKEAKSF